MCSGAKPPESINCTASQDDDKCDDGDPETMGDVCTGSSCAGKVALVAAVTFAMPTAALQDLRIPTEDVDASPLANAVKQSLVSALASSMTGLTADDITILGLSTARRRRLQAGGSLVVDYKIEVAAAQATDTVKTAATTAAAAITTVTIPAEATVSSTEITPTVTATAEAFVSYAYVKTAGTCPATPCSDVCGVDETTEPDTYACEADGAASADASCVGAGLVEPVTVTACCPAADVATCVEPAAPPPPDAPEPEPEPESESDTPWAAIIGGGAGGLVLLGVIYAVGTQPQGLGGEMGKLADDLAEQGAAVVKAEINRRYSEVLSRERDPGEFVIALCAGDKILTDVTGKIYPAKNEIVAALSAACLVCGVVPRAQMTDANHAKAKRIVDLYGLLLDLVIEHQNLLDQLALANKVKDIFFKEQDSFLGELGSGFRCC
jgi:hypothetical protein